MSATRFRERYGAGPGHLVGVVACLLLGGYALLRFLGDAGPFVDLLVWLVAAIALFDFVIFPVSTALDRALQRVARGAPPLVNHVRVPSALSALILLVFFPLILGLSDDHLHSAAALDSAPYLGRWLLITAALFIVSILIYLIRLLRRRLA